MNKQNYLQEGLRQLYDSSHYIIQEEDPTQEYNNQIHQVLQQAVNPNIIDDKTMKTLYNKSPRTLNFYMLPKIHKPNKPGRLIVNGIWNITERISAYVDQQIRHIVPRIPSYLTDTTHLLHLLLGKRLAPQDLLITIDVPLLYTNMANTESMQALNRILEKAHTDPMKKLLICRLDNLVLTKNYFSFNNSLYKTDTRYSHGNKNGPFICQHIYEIHRNPISCYIPQETENMV